MRKRPHKDKDMGNRWLSGYPVIGTAVCVLLICCAAFLSSCAPTYPKESLHEAVKEICKIEYNMEVDAAVEGSTLGIYYPMEGLFDVGLNIPESSWDRISNLILVASRVVLSTDADIKFYCVITKDARLPDIQVIIIKYVEDIKRGMYRNISRNESFKRTLFSINLTPQAQKERSIEQVFDKLGLDEESRETVLDEFFRSPPTKLSDIGYWRGNFYLKDISLEEFLASQIANRIKIDFSREDDLKEFYQYKHAEGNYVVIPSDDKRFFLIKFKIFDQAGSVSMADLRKDKIRKILEIINEVVYGYKFKNFDFVELEDQLENTKMWVLSDDVYEFNTKRLSVDEIVRTSKEYFSGTALNSGILGGES